METHLQGARSARQSAILIATNDASTLVFEMGVFFDACETWRLKPDADKKTWTNFKTHFGEAQRQLRLQNATMQASGCHEANGKKVVKMMMIFCAMGHRSLFSKFKILQDPVHSFHARGTS